MRAASALVPARAPVRDEAVLRGSAEPRRHPDEGSSADELRSGAGRAEAHAVTSRLVEREEAIDEATCEVGRERFGAEETGRVDREEDDFHEIERG